MSTILRSLNIFADHGSSLHPSLSCPLLPRGWMVRCQSSTKPPQPFSLSCSLLSSGLHLPSSVLRLNSNLDASTTSASTTTHKQASVTRCHSWNKLVPSEQPKALRSFAPSDPHLPFHGRLRLILASVVTGSPFTSPFRPHPSNPRRTSIPILTSISIKHA